LNTSGQRRICDSVRIGWAINGISARPSGRFVSNDRTSLAADQLLSLWICHKFPNKFVSDAQSIVLSPEAVADVDGLIAQPGSDPKSSPCRK
jgi:hypothetical protein